MGYTIPNLNLKDVTPGGVQALNRWADSVTTQFAELNSQTAKAGTTGNNAQTQVTALQKQVDSLTFTDGLTHGDSIWDIDPAYILQRDDFLQGVVTSGSIGTLGWITSGTSTGVGYSNGTLPNLGLLGIVNDAVQNNTLTIYQTINSTQLGTFPFNAALPLLDIPSWKMIWVFGFGQQGALTTGLPSATFSMAGRTCYLGLQFWITTPIGRPSIFIGARYDTDTTTPSINDSAIHLECTVNTLSNSRNNTIGQQVSTGVVPTPGSFYRLEIECVVVGQVTVSLFYGTGSTSTTFTVPHYTQTIGTSQVTDGIFALSTSGGSYSCAVAGTTATFSGLTHVSGLNGAQTIIQNTSGDTLSGNTSLANVSSGSESATLTNYSGLIPFFEWGNNSTTGSPAENGTFLMDFFSFVWNPGVGGGTETPNYLKARYW